MIKLLGMAGKKSLIVGATRLVLLNGRTLHRTVRAKHAAIPRIRLKYRTAAFAVVKKLAGVGRHGLRLGVSAVRAGQRGFENQRTHFGSALMEDG